MSHIVLSRGVLGGGRGSDFRGGGTKGREFWEILGERVSGGGGYPFLDRTEIIFVQNDI
jgi:hypothetical protein